jgi:hypothetical protein
MLLPSTAAILNEGAVRHMDGKLYKTESKLSLNMFESELMAKRGITSVY